MRHAVVVTAVVVAIAVAGCSSKDAAAPVASTSATVASTSATAPVASTSATSPVSTSSAAASTPPAADGTVIAIVVTGGKVATKDTVVKVKQGTKVTIIVSSDVADEVHVHGYDIKKDVAANATIQIPFTADQTGSFEVELEKAATQLISLQVR